MDILILNEYYDGDVAGVELLVTDADLDIGFTVKANSRRDPIDEPDEEVALLLAHGRALEKAAKKLQKRADGKVRHNDNLREMRPLQKKRNESRKSLLKLAGIDLQGRGAVKTVSPAAKLNRQVWNTWNQGY